MIVGLGVEIVDVARFDRLLERYGARLTERIFTEGERAYATRKRRGRESLAVRFAAKVAARRALAGEGLGWREIEVTRNRGEAPTLRFHGAAARAAAARGVAHVALTLTHDPPWCIGQVFLEGEQ